MLKDNKGRTVALCLGLLVAAILGGALSGLYAANNSAPDGWGMYNRARAKWAMGQEHVFWAHCSATNTLPATGLAAGDMVWGAVNIEVPGETATAYGSTLTVAANSLTSSGTPWNVGSMYLVFVHRAQADDR